MNSICLSTSSRVFSFRVLLLIQCFSCPLWVNVNRIVYLLLACLFPANSELPILSLSSINKQKQPTWWKFWAYTLCSTGLRVLLSLRFDPHFLQTSRHVLWSFAILFSARLLLSPFLWTRRDAFPAFNILIFEVKRFHPFGPRKECEVCVECVELWLSQELHCCYVEGNGDDWSQEGVMLTLSEKNVNFFKLSLTQPPAQRLERQQEQPSPTNYSSKS